MTKKMTAVVGISGVLDKSLEKAIETAQERIGGINQTALKVSGALVGIGAAAATVGKEILQFGDNYNQAMNDLRSKTGASAAEMKGLGDVVRGVYENNFGESINDVAAGVAQVKKMTGEVGPALQKTTEGAFALSDTFEYDIAESTRAAKAMIQNMGIDGEKAMSMIAAGAQNGLDYSGELLDSVSEYSVQFGKLGFSADQMFSVFQQGADSGAWNLDKVGDAVKEFSIRSIDGSNTTLEAYQKLGLNADDMMQKFAAGGDTANQSFKDVVDKLMDMDNAVERDAVGVALFGTMWEDLGVDAVKALASATDGAYDTKNALDGIKEVKYNDLGSAMEGIKRTLEVSLLPAASAFANKLVEMQPSIEAVMGFVIDNSNILIPLVGALGSAYAGLKFANLVNGARGLSSAFNVLSLTKGKDKMATQALGGTYTKTTIAQKASTVATKVWSGVSKVASIASRGLGVAIRFMTGPIGWVVTGIGLAVAAGVALYKNWDTVKAYAVAFGAKIKGVFVGMKNKVVGVFSTLKDKIGGAFSGLAAIVKSPINSVIGIVNKAIRAINDISIDIPDWVPKWGGKSFGANIPQLPYLATGGFTTGPSIAGEAGTEAIISFDSRHRAENLAYWAKAGMMLGATPENEYILSGGSNKAINLDGLKFNPVINIHGDAKKQDVIDAIREAFPEFVDLLEEWISVREEFTYG